MLIPYLVAGGGALLLAAAGGLMTNIGPWYRDLKKPRLQPPNWLFGPAWTVILAAAAASAAIAWDAAPDAATKNRVVLVFVVNALLHFLWSPLFFRLKRPDWAFIEIIPFWFSILWAIHTVAPLSSLAAWLLLPYIVWVSFAAVLNLGIVRLNRPFGT